MSNESEFLESIQGSLGCSESPSIESQIAEEFRFGSLAGAVYASLNLPHNELPLLLNPHDFVAIYPSVKSFPNVVRR